ncbi:hypothetical protein BG454_04885 [Roseinatronobacter bogoriensis subsp. barguzinensis]|uniref:Uncharacterized protein n=1 Tax=Roseinatronobacter bogoriensis subsp. barguzinensis TaxID=441209 RepID=A0A2K8KBG1_9RHOB|nr:hypothetical protein BG454_04885 [Rhodobaca barguzinensis]
MCFLVSGATIPLLAGTIFEPGYERLFLQGFGISKLFFIFVFGFQRSTYFGLPKDFPKVCGCFLPDIKGACLRVFV